MSLQLTPPSVDEDGSPEEPIAGNVGEDPPLAARVIETFQGHVRADRKGQHIDGDPVNRTMEGEPPELQPGIVYAHPEAAFTAGHSLHAAELRAWRLSATHRSLPDLPTRDRMSIRLPLDVPDHQEESV